ncbi:MAG: hypothetical protein ACI9ON_002665 [Limisphaerales bacterium]|jgi:hypothetical protein
MKTHTQLAKLGLIGLATCALSTNVAAEPRGHFPIIIADVEVRQAQRFDALDQDNDDAVTLAEFENGPSPDRKMHHDRRGEHRNNRGDKSERRLAMRKSVDEELFKILDTDGDGSLSPAEHSAGDSKTKGLARKRAGFAKLDANADGKLTASELPSRADRLKQADSNQDGKVTRSEMASMRRATRQAG